MAWNTEKEDICRSMAEINTMTKVYVRARSPSYLWSFWKGWLQSNIFKFLLEIKACKLDSGASLSLNIPHSSSLLWLLSVSFLTPRPDRLVDWRGGWGGCPSHHLGHLKLIIWSWLRHKAFLHEKSPGQTACQYAGCCSAGRTHDAGMCLIKRQMPYFEFVFATLQGCVTVIVHLSLRTDYMNMHHCYRPLDLKCILHVCAVHRDVASYWESFSMFMCVCVCLCVLMTWHTTHDDRGASEKHWDWINRKTEHIRTPLRVSVQSQLVVCAPRTNTRFHTQ